VVKIKKQLQNEIENKGEQWVVTVDFGLIQHKIGKNANFFFKKGLN